jgi:CrcB protein
MVWLRGAGIVAMGSVVGANLRYLVSDWVSRNYSASFPYGTLTVNATGSLALGFFLVWSTDRVLSSPILRVLRVLGFCDSW